MPRIVNNRICYADHNVVLDEAYFKANGQFAQEYILEMGHSLTEGASSHEHRAELFEMNNDGTWTIEMPEIELRPTYASEVQEHRPEWYLPTGIQVEVYLHNGNYRKLLTVFRQPNCTPFKIIFQMLYQAGYPVGAVSRRKARQKYAAQIAQLRAAYNPPMVDTTL